MAVGEGVRALRISGGWATEATVPARDVFAKPASLSYGEAANLLLAGCTASETLHVTGVGEGDTILVHGPSGAVGYGDGLEQRVRELAPDGIVTALDCVGTDEAVDVSLARAGDRNRIVTIAAADRAKS